MKYLIKRFLLFIMCRQGAVTISYALMLPTLIGFFSLAIDGARFITERSRLSDAINQGVYSIAMSYDSDDKNADTEKTVLYLSYHLPAEKIDKNKVYINVDKEKDKNGKVVSTDFSLNSDVITHPLLSLYKEGYSGFHSNITLHGGRSSGHIRKSLEDLSVPADYTFVLDFSGSMTNSSAERGYTRIELLKKVFTDLGNRIFDNDNGSTIGIVPFSTGIPAVLDKTNYASATSKEVGCTYIGKLKDKYSGLDWSFWYNKSLGKTTYTNYISKTDGFLYDYYKNVIAKANGYQTTASAEAWLIDKGYCRKGSGKLACDADPNSDIHNPDNNEEFHNNYDKFHLLTELVSKHYTSITNPETMDYEGTVADDYLFTDDNVVTFINYLNAPSTSYSSVHVIPSDAPVLRGDAPVHVIPFDSLCAYATSGTRDHGNVVKFIKTIEKPNFYLVELTDNRSIINDFNSMGPPGGGTDSISGLLRAVPLITKGKNDVKMIFVISDGEDNTDSKQVRKKLMDKYHLCDVIRNGLKKYPAGTTTTDVEIYYISLVSNNSISDWQNSCVGSGHAFIATNYDALYDVIAGAMARETTRYVNPDE
ncbi:VWA domain-containing protein [Citrobacter amalonaticus]|uniref:VWA domain-containing protein n=1 Tax=Citrobacter amalonaticus TaxID=35703 RepID=UPI000A3C6094|nr:VWA domain-containing protein [Citrobacter amalonaticus]OUE59692.1 hypothetical protein AZ012_003978 [Citrobacter amalonaticus]